MMRGRIPMAMQRRDELCAASDVAPEMEPTHLIGVSPMRPVEPDRPNSHRGKQAKITMRARRIEQTALTTLFVAACVMFFIAAFAAIAHAQNPSSSLTVPAQPEVPVSPTTPGTLPGTEAGPGTTVGTNPITGQPCIGGGASALNGGLPGAPTTSDQPGESSQNANGLPPDNSVYGRGNTNPAAC